VVFPEYKAPSYLKIRRIIVNDIKNDVYAMVYNFWYNGWAYRIESEGQTIVAKDSEVAAKKTIEQYNEYIRNELLEEQAKARQEKLYGTKEAIQP